MTLRYNIIYRIILLLRNVQVEMSVILFLNYNIELRNSAVIKIVLTPDI